MVVSIAHAIENICEAAALHGCEAASHHAGGQFLVDKIVPCCDQGLELTGVWWLCVDKAGAHWQRKKTKKNIKGFCKPLMSGHGPSSTHGTPGAP